MRGGDRSAGAQTVVITADSRDSAVMLQFQVICSNLPGGSQAAGGLCTVPAIQKLAKVGSERENTVHMLLFRALVASLDCA